MKKKLYKQMFTLKQFKDEASKYNSRQEFKKKANRYYFRAYYSGLLDKIFPQKKKFTLAQCKKDALKYSNNSDWKSNSAKVYGRAKYNGWYKLCTKHFVSMRGKGGTRTIIWTKAKCMAEAKKHKYIFQWILRHEYSYKRARKKGWFAQCTKHMKKRMKWTKENCILEAKKHKTITEWAKTTPSSFVSSKRNGCFDQCIKHMTA